MIPIQGRALLITGLGYLLGSAFLLSTIVTLVVLPVVMISVNYYEFYDDCYCSVAICNQPLPLRHQ